MSKDEAGQLMNHLLALSDPLNDATAVTQRMDDKEEAKAIRRKLAAIMSSAYDAMLPIIREYPELDPDKHRALKSVKSGTPIKILPFYPR